MAKRRLTARQIVREVQLAARAQIIERANVGEAEITAAWAPHLRRLSQRLATARRSEVQGVINETIRELARASIDPIQRSMRDGSIVGMRASERQHERLTEPGGPVHTTARQRESFASPVTLARAREIAQERIGGATTPDGVRLSTRMYRDAREAGQHAARVVRESIDTRQGIHEAAEEFIASTRGNMQARQPAYIERIARAARQARDTGDNTRLLEVIEGHRGQMNRLGQGAGSADGEFSIRSTVRQFVADVPMRPQDIDALLARHMEDRLQVQARRLVRHETAEAMRASYLESVSSKPYVKGVRWTLSPAHPKPDVCDLYAMQALHGLGPGGYPLDEVPETPHPGCLCMHVSIIDEEHFSRRLAARTGEPEPPRTWENPLEQSAHDWLATQPEAFRRQVLGPTRLAIFDHSEEGRRHVIDARGRPIPVGEAEASWQRRER
jgi:hypothetical protein